MSTYHRLLIQARCLIEDEDNWTTKQMAQDEYGDKIYFADPGACMFCAFGAICLAAHQLKSTFDDKMLAVKALEEACGERITAFNDNRTHAEVLEVFDLAIGGYQ